MEKLLRAEVFKRHNFATKEDGMNFIKSNDEVMKFIEQKDIELIEIYDEKIDEFDKLLEYPGIKEDKELAALESKDKAKTRVAKRKAQKEEVIKRDLRSELKQEIMREMQKEKEDLTKIKYKGFYPEVHLQDFDLDAYFTQQINTDKITKEKLKKLKAWSSEIDKHRAALNTIINEIQNN